MNHQKLKKWDYIFLVSQLILLIFALIFVYQQKYFLAIVLLVLSGGIGSAKNANLIIKRFNRINLGLAVFVACYWLYLEVFIK